MNIMYVVVGVILVVLGILGIGKNQKKNRWLVQMIGDTGYRLFLILMGVVFLVLSFIL